MSSAEHRFGGEWTEIKLAVLDAYSNFFVTALKNKNFEQWYVDAFAGTGERTQTRQTGGLFEAEPLSSCEETLEGSARRALAIMPPFRHLVLIEKRRKHFEALEGLRRSHPGRDIRTVHGDANDEIPRLFRSAEWTGAEAFRQRALVFLDPYGMNVRFDTLRALADCRKADVWLLVNVKAAVQQLARNHEKLDEGKRVALSRFFGTEEWEAAFYQFREVGSDLFTAAAARAGERTAGRQDVGRFYKARLDTIFAYVSEPFDLKVRSLDGYFQLYCMSNSKSQAALDLIKRGCTAVQKAVASASH